MPQKNQSPDQTQDSTREIALATTAQALAQTAQLLNSVSQQLIQALQGLAGAAPAGLQQAVGGVVAPTVQINTWEDDPFSEEITTADPAIAATLAVPAPVNNNQRLLTAIVEAGPAANSFLLGTEDFRFWVVQEALARGINFWTPFLPAGTIWSAATNPLSVTLVAGVALNATYSRAFGLRFYKRPVRNTTIFSAESPDIVLHELGHAILDALQPRLFHADSLEVAAFHEAFGDMSSILGELQMPTFRQRILAETNGRLNTNSRLSRVAEQLGWGIRQVSPTAVDRDCLRNAANRFFYTRPSQLPPSAPASSLASDAHSFSRVFTGAFLDALSGMLEVLGAPTEANLLTVSQHMGQLLADGVRTASVSSNYYSQVAASMIQADRVRHQSRYLSALTRAFVRRGILATQSVVALNAAPTPTIVPAPTAPLAMAMAGLGAFGGAEAKSVITYDGDDQDYAHGFGATQELPLRSIPTDLGITVMCHVPDEPERFNVGPSIMDPVRSPTVSPEEDASDFVKSLIQLDRVEMGSVRGIAPGFGDLPKKDETRKTHVLEERSDGVVLTRRHFDCGFGCAS
jgi:hypothetical protein